MLRFIEPCLPSPADRPPSGTNWIHEIKHDGYRLMARRDSVGIRLITRRGNDWSDRFALVVEAVTHLKVRSARSFAAMRPGFARFDVLRRRRNEAVAFLFAFDLLELDGADLRREPLEVRKATLANHPTAEPARRAAERAPGARLRADGFPACLRARLRGHRLQATGIALPIRALAGLAKVQESGGAGGEA